MTPDEIEKAIAALSDADRQGLLARILPSDSCWWCGRESTRLCDTMLLDPVPVGASGYRDDQGRNVILPRRRVLAGDLTCSAHVCDACTRELTEVRFCGEHGGSTDTLDRCPFCEQAPGLNKTIEADEYRRLARLHAIERRRAIK